MIKVRGYDGQHQNQSGLWYHWLDSNKIFSLDNTILVDVTLIYFIKPTLTDSSPEATDSGSRTMIFIPIIGQSIVSIETIVQKDHCKYI